MAELFILFQNVLGENLPKKWEKLIEILYIHESDVNLTVASLYY